MEDRCKEIVAGQIGLEFRDLFAIVNLVDFFKDCSRRLLRSTSIFEFDFHPAKAGFLYFEAVTLCLRSSAVGHPGTLWDQVGRNRG